MSIFSLQGFGLKVCRQAFILASHRRPEVHFELPPVTNFVARGAHNSLYQMVKKRTLEARTKLQPTKYPNNDAQAASLSACSQPPDPDPDSCSPTPLSNQDLCSSAKEKESNKIKERTRTGSCQNQEVLRAEDCHSRAYIPLYAPCMEAARPEVKGKAEIKARTEVTPKTETKLTPAKFAAQALAKFVTQAPTKFVAQAPAKFVAQAPAKFVAQAPAKFAAQAPSAAENPPCNTPPQPTKPACKPPPRPAGRQPCPPIEPIDCSGGGGGGLQPPDNNLKMLMGLLAALATGGLLWYLLTGKKDKKDCPKVTDSASDAVLTVPQRTIPASSSDLPKNIPYLLIGGGTASFSAFRAIKANDPRAKILMITNELKKPYMRPPLSKELWYSAQKGEVSPDFRFKQWTGSERSLFFEPDEFFVDPMKLVESVNGGIAVAQGFSVRKIDPENRIATLSDGYEIGYDECLIATGCAPKNLSVFESAPLSVKERVMVYRTPDDFERLKRYADQKRSITIVGNGFIGSELACSLANYSKDKAVKIYQVFPESGNMSKVLPEYLSKWTTKKVEALGVCVLPNASVRNCRRDEATLKLELSNGSTILTDVVVVCVGCEANTQIANVSGLEVDRSLGGFVVNAELEARRNLFVAGDASCFYDPLLGRRRVEHHDHSVVSGRLAGENMVGKKKAYTHQSMFWSDLGPEIGYEGIGLVDAKLPTVGVFALPSRADRHTDNLTESRTEQIESGDSLKSGKDVPDVKCDDRDPEQYGRGVIFYMKDEKIVGILLWNLFNRVGLARTIINQNKKFDDLNEVAKLFEIHA